MLFSRWLYYLSSIPTLLLGVRNWVLMLAVFLHLPVRKPFTVELRRSGNRFKGRTPMDIWIIKETCLDQTYEQAGVALQDGWIVLDIGAAFGDFSIHAAKGHPNTVVYAFEPFPESFALLQQNVALNKLTNIKMLPYAVGSPDTTEMTLYANAPDPGQHRTVSSVGQPEANAIKVPSISLDRVFEEHNLPRCDFLKIDCEGAEYQILFNASAQTLAKIKYVGLEYHDGVTAYNHDDLVRFFREKGFQVKRQPSPAHRHIGFLYALNTQHH